MAELQYINSSGELTEIKLGGTADSDKVAKIEDVPDLGNYSFDGDNIVIDGGNILEYLNPGGLRTTTLRNNNLSLYLEDITEKIRLRTNEDSTTEVTELYLIGGGTPQARLSVTKVGVEKGLLIDSTSIRFIGLSTAEIDAAGVDSAVTKEWVESKIAGATNTFTSQDGKTVTVVNGLITEIT